MSEQSGHAASGEGPHNASWGAVGRLYHGWFTGLILYVASRRGADAAADLMFHVMRRQHLATFLPGLRKLGLEGLPHAVAAAQYHYLSNLIGGVRVEYMPETERKAWVRYAPPRWVWQGAAICGVPPAVSTAMLRAWHGHNGVSLGNPRLGFVCTKQTVDGQDGLEGYYYEHDRALEPDERVRFARDEEAPPFDPAKAPVLPTADWPAERLAKAERNYAMEYARSALSALVALFGPAEARHLGGGSAYLIGMQFYDECRALLGHAAPGAEGFAAWFAAMAAGQDDAAHAERRPDGSLLVRQSGWRLLRGLEHPHPVMAEIWNALWEGCLAAHDRFLTWRMEEATLADGGAFRWRLSRR
ncbi:MAG: hypothetical protein JSR21_17425 [Proteobacteria bacterium]|nr:hypothetical protein [Pseudomonadota bacterium]